MKASELAFSVKQMEPILALRAEQLLAQQTMKKQ